jgi:hypothetical protein
MCTCPSPPRMPARAVGQQLQSACSAGRTVDADKRGGFVDPSNTSAQSIPPNRVRRLAPGVIRLAHGLPVACGKPTEEFRSSVWGSLPEGKPLLRHRTLTRPACPSSRRAARPRLR